MEKTLGSDLQISTGRHPQTVQYDRRVMHRCTIILAVCAMVGHRTLEPAGQTSIESIGQRTGGSSLIEWTATQMSLVPTKSEGKS
jgi:hypothetical protein